MTSRAHRLRLVLERPAPLLVAGAHNPLSALLVARQRLLQGVPERVVLDDDGHG